MIEVTEIEDRADIEQADRPSLVAYLEENGFQCYDYENEEVLRVAALEHWDSENKTVFQYHELSDSAKEKVRHWLEPDHEWWDSVYEQAKEDGKERGFDIDDISFSGFWSQGDGASWKGTVNIEEYLTYARKDAAPDTAMEILLVLLENGNIDKRLTVNNRDNHYSHSGTMRMDDLDWTDLDPDDDQAITIPGVFHGAFVAVLMHSIGVGDGYMGALETEILEAVRGYADEIYKNLEAEYDYLTSDDAIKETCEANEYTFDEDGKLTKEK